MKNAAACKRLRRVSAAWRNVNALANVKHNISDRRRCISENITISAKARIARKAYGALMAQA